jgi:hypothetical protein
MIHSLFVINHSGDVFMEKHWKSIIPRTVCDYFFEVQRQVVKDNKGPEDVPPIIATPHHYLISIYRNNLFFVAVCMSEGNFFSYNFLFFFIKQTIYQFHVFSPTNVCNRISPSSG